MNCELKPCPFCGSEASIVEVTERPEGFVEEAFIQCEGCGFSFHHKWLSVETLIRYWNTRADHTCKPNKQGRCECGALIRWEENCEPYKTCDGLTAFRSIHPPVTRYHNYCPKCGAKVVQE